ncbi:von Hippel-Lindau disease tumor suppressor-like [Diadema antillarum]|uniref:von Hippel-Lindau disease tumor suppressor-like n=1 Tax=Diadema antillarum TaxID=105358 RepID=UPI003A88086E
MGDHNTADDRAIPQPLRSLHCTAHAFVSFVNCTNRIANVFWINFQGQRKSYTTEGLPPGRRLDIKTFLSHPWIARDFQTGDALTFVDRGSASCCVYMPERWDGNRHYRAPIVRIGVPVFTLYERSLQVVRTLVPNKDDFDDLEIPKHVKYDLRHVEDAIP